jgi:hypothetical protein
MDLGISKPDSLFARLFHVSGISSMQPAPTEFGRNDFVGAVGYRSTASLLGITRTFLPPGTVSVLPFSASSRGTQFWSTAALAPD